MWQAVSVPGAPLLSSFLLPSKLQTDSLLPLAPTAAAASGCSRHGNNSGPDPTSFPLLISLHTRARTETHTLSLSRSHKYNASTTPTPPLLSFFPLRDWVRFLQAWPGFCLWRHVCHTACMTVVMMAQWNRRTWSTDLLTLTTIYHQERFYLLWSILLHFHPVFFYTWNESSFPFHLSHLFYPLLSILPLIILSFSLLFFFGS